MKYFSSLIAVFFSLWLPLMCVCPAKGSALVSGSVPALNVSAESAILLEVSDGARHVVWEKNAGRVRGMASTTKIMTSLLALESMPLSTVIRIPSAAVGVEGSSVYLTEGEELTLGQLLLCVMLESANDAATAVAIAVGGSVERFSALMNEKAASLSLTNTHFTNPHGLDDKDHYTTAYDLAMLAAAALENPDFAAVAGAKRASVPHASGGRRYLINHNRLLGSYPGCLGVKTGYTRASGRCLVTAAERNGLRFIAVTLGAPDDWQDHKNMLDAGFAFYESVPLAAANGGITSPYAASLPDVSVIGGEQTHVSVVFPRDVRAVLIQGHGAVICRLELTRSLPAPVDAGDRVGRVEWYCDGERIAECDAVAQYGAAASKPRGFLARFISRLRALFGG